MPKIIENLETKLLEEARRQIEVSGYSAMTIRSVAAACGVGVGTVYNYFRSKEELLATYMLRDWQQCLEVIHEAADQAVEAALVVRSIYDQLRLYAAGNQALFQDPSAASSFAGSFSRYHGLLRGQLARPLRRFCNSEFAAEFIAEALLTWTMAGRDFDEIYSMIGHLFCE